MRFLALLSFLLVLPAVTAQKKYPTDKPMDFSGEEQVAKMDELIAPAVAKAKKGLPKTKQKYLDGLKDGQTLYLTIRIYDADGKFEQIFVEVTKWEGETVTGKIANQLRTVKSYSYRQTISFPERDILDWTIVLPNGKEKGNYVGKFIDKLQKK